MIEHSFDAANAILHIRPKGPLAQSDFAALAKSVDPYIEKAGALAGLVIELAGFPGWENLGAMAAHFRFVRDHHRQVKKVAVVTDSALGKVAENLASHFVAAEIKRFPAGGLEGAQQWILQRT
jgi:hypothetical protein